MPRWSGTPPSSTPHQEARRLSGELGLGVAVTALAGNDILFLERVGEHRPRDIGVQVGQRVPLVPPVGAVFVAWHDAESWLARADNRQDMEEVLADVRIAGGRRRWATLPAPTTEALATLDPHRAYDVVMIAAPVFGRGGDAVVSLTLLGIEPGLPGPAGGRTRRERS